MTLKEKFAETHLSLESPTVLYDDTEHAVYWLGIMEETAFRCNAYLIRNGDEAILVDPGNRAFFGQVRDRVAQIMPPEAVTGMIICHQDPDVAASMVDWVALNPKITVYTSPRTKILLHHYGLDTFPYCDIVEKPRLEFPDGRALRFIESPFLHFPGAFVTFDEAGGFLLSGDIWAALDMEWQLVVGDFESHTASLDLFHIDYMASNIAAHGFVERIRDLPIEAILPQHGSIISKEDVNAALAYLDELHCGTDVIYGTGFEGEAHHELHTVKAENEKLKKQLARYKEALVQDQNIRHKYDRAMEEVRTKNQLLLLQSRMAAMGEMAATLAHEWRQPLTHINMRINNLLLKLELAGKEKGEVAESMRKTSAELKLLSETIGDFRKFFHSQAGENSRVEVEEVMESICGIYKKRFEERGITMDKRIESHANIHVSRDEFIQVCTAILNNASEVFTSRGINEPKISVRIYEEGEHVVFEYCDNGGGIREKVPERIFEPYYSTKKEQNNVGLGLYLAKIAVEKEMGGTLRVENREGGACFLVILPKGAQ